MPEVKTNGISLYYEASGEGAPIVFVHEFAGDYRSWEDQTRYFNRRYKVVTFNARGFPPSEVPQNASQYSQDIAVDDLAGLIRGLKLAPAHVVGLSMGGYATLHLGLRHPELTRSIVVAGCGYGSELDKRAQFQKDANLVADRFLNEGITDFGPIYTAGPTRMQLKRKDMIGYQRFIDHFMSHSALGCANTMRGVQSARPSVYALEEQMKHCVVPTLILTGDEDYPCLEPALFMKRHIQAAALITFPNAGHLINLEEPAMFNRVVLEFITDVDTGRWPTRDPRSMGESALLPDED